jgi:DNA-binding XRE family transcriptional regulator
LSTIVDIKFHSIWNFVSMEEVKKKKAGKKLGKKIQQIRKSQKISQEQLAFESGLSRQYISYLESGLKSPTIDTLLSISEVLNIHVKDLLDFNY